MRHGYVVVEGRSVHTTAVYQSLILHPDNDAMALAEADAILQVAAHWRPLPDLTLLITDDVTAAIERMERRDRRRCTPEQRHLHHRADWLFTQLARAEPARIRVLDRRRTDPDAVVQAMAAAAAETPPRQEPPSASNGDTT